MTKVLFVGGSYTSGTTNYDNDGYYWSSTDGINWAKSASSIKISGIQFYVANGVNFGFFNSKYFLFSLNITSSPNNSAFHTSEDLLNWTANTVVTSNVPRGTVLNFNNKLWAVGGVDGTFSSGYRPAKVFSSADGVNWTNTATLYASTSSTNNYFLDGKGIVANNKMYLMAFREGALGSAGVTNKIYYSSDGTAWSSTTAQWSARTVPVLNYINGTFVLIGGIQSDNTTKIADLWTSVDGLTWTPRTYPSIFPAGGIFGGTPYSTSLKGSNSFIKDGKMFLFGGGLSSIYSTTDGENWVIESASPIQVISTRGTVIPTLEGLVSATVRASASSSSSMGLTLTKGDMLLITSNIISSSTFTFGNFIIPEIIWFPNINITSTSFGMVASGLVSPIILRPGNGVSISSINVMIEFLDVSTHLISGRVIIGSNPISNATVIAVNQDIPTYSYKTTTDENGNYSLICSRNGKYLVVCFYKDGNGNAYTAFSKPFIQIGGA